MVNGNMCDNSVGRVLAVVRRWRRLTASVGMMAFVSFYSGAWAGTTERVSVDDAGAEGNSGSDKPSISGDGRYAAFLSAASNLVPGDTNGFEDVFVRDRDAGLTARVSVASTGAQGNDGSMWPSISGDGRYVAFTSRASNLVPGDTNGRFDVFVRDRDTSLTQRVSIATSGVQANNDSESPSISFDGRFVAFISNASNLVSGDTNGFDDVFVYDRDSGTTVRISVDSGGAQGNHHSSDPSISSDGRYVAFLSFASNLVPGDTNGLSDVFVHDRDTGLTERVSMSSVGAEGNGHTSSNSDSADSPSISADGRFVAFLSSANNLVPGDTNGFSDVFVHDRDTGLTERVSVARSGVEANNRSFRPSISADGRYVAFFNAADNLAPNDTNTTHDVFVHDRSTGVTERVSVASAGTQANGGSSSPSISGDGRYVAFVSLASDLVPGDTNGALDVIMHDRGPLVPLIGCVGFDTPMATHPVKAKKNRVFPLKMELFDDLGFEVIGPDLSAAPVVEVIYTAVGGEPIDVSDEALPAGAGSEGNQFAFTDDDIWQFNLKSTNYSAEGSYVVTAVSGDASAYQVDPSCVTSFVITY